MKQVILAQRYLDAFIKNVTPEKTDLALKQVRKMGEVIYTHHELYTVLSNPIIPIETRNNRIETRNNRIKT